MNYFITGVSSGIGRELTRQLIKSGHGVYGVARRTELLQELHQELGSDNFVFKSCDVSQAEDIAVVVDHLKELNYVPDIIIFNAAINMVDIVSDIDYQKFKQIMQVNIYGVVDWLGPLLSLVQERPAKFVAISSTAAFRPIYGNVAYPASKAAIAMVFRGLNLVYAKINKFFKVVYLGPIATDISLAYKKRANNTLIKLLIPSPAYAAAKIIRFSSSKKSQIYIPWLSTMIFYLLRVLPDSWFSYLGMKFRREG